MTSRRTPRVYLHVGEPKTGTTFLQQVMWRNRAALAAQGVVLPGHHPQDHFRASHDLRGVPRPDDDPAGAWEGEWELLAQQALRADHAAVISHELFSAVEPDQADRAVRSLRGAELHIIVTVRDMATLIPAEWQETVKHRNKMAWRDWLVDVIDDEAPLADRRRFWFWRVHDTAQILAMWSRKVPAHRVHVVTVPPAGAPTGLLWERFAEVIGIDPASVDISRADPNTSLGIPEIEFLRQLNHRLPDEVPEWFYMGTVKEEIAHRALGSRARVGRVVLPEQRLSWASEYAEALIESLKDSGFDIVGDLDDLRPPPFHEPEFEPGDETAEQMLDAAMDTVTALLVNQYRRSQPAVRPRAAAAPAGLIGRVESAVAASPTIKRRVRDMSSRYRSVRRLRVLAWRSMQRSRVRGDV